MNTVQESLPSDKASPYTRHNAVIDSADTTWMLRAASTAGALRGVYVQCLVMSESGPLDLAEICCRRFRCSFIF